MRTRNSLWLAAIFTAVALSGCVVGEDFEDELDPSSTPPPGPPDLADLEAGEAIAAQSAPLSAGYLYQRPGQPFSNTDWMRIVDDLSCPSNCRSETLRRGESYVTGVMFFPSSSSYQPGGGDHFVSAPTVSGTTSHAGVSSRGELLFNVGAGAIVTRDSLKAEIWLGGAGNFSIPASRSIPTMQNGSWYYLYTRVRRSLVKTLPGKADVYASLYRWTGSSWTFQGSLQSPTVFVPDAIWGGPSHTKSMVGWLGDRANSNPMVYAHVSQYGRR